MPRQKTTRPFFIARFAVFIIPFLLFLTVCCTGEYARIELTSGYGDIDIHGLIRNSEQFKVWAAGEGAYITALIFDPRGDEMEITTHEWWYRVETREQIQKMVQLLEGDIAWPPRLYQIHGPEKKFYGYLYSIEAPVTITRTKENTLRVGNILPPPRDRIDVKW